MNRAHRRSSGLLRLAVVFCLLPAAMARADIDVWYELVGAASPGPNPVIVQQGGPGEPLVLTTDYAAGSYQLRIRMVAAIPEPEAILTYHVDLTAPNANNIAVKSIAYLETFDFDFPPTPGAGPGIIVAGAGQLNAFSPPRAGMLDLCEFVINVQRPPADTIQIFSAVGPAGWARDDGQEPMIGFADAAPLPGWTTGVISSTASIIILQAPAPPPPPDPPIVPPSGGGGSSSTPPPDAAAGPTSETPSGGGDPPAGTPKVIDRTGLRSFLACLFGVPVEGAGACAAGPLFLLGPFGLNVNVLFGIFDMFQIPLRAMIFEFTYALLDTLLP